MSPLDSFHLSFPASRFPSHGLTRPRANLRATIAVYPSTFSSLSIPHSIQLSFSSSTSFSRPSSYRPLVLALPSRRIVFSLPTRERDHSRLLIHQRERIRDVRGENYGLRVRSRCCCVNKRQHGTPREDSGFEDARSCFLQESGFEISTIPDVNTDIRSTRILRAINCPSMIFPFLWQNGLSRRPVM